MTTTAILTSEASHSSRETSAKSNSLDGWRALACLMVLFHHTGFYLHLGQFAILGSTGVFLFFVLSGYLLYLPICKSIQRRKFIDLKLFFIRRLFRIYPAYLVALVVYSFTRYLMHIHPPSSANVMSHLLMAFNSSDQREFFGIAGIFWSLAIEAQFYVLLPLLALLIYNILKRRPGLAVFAIPVLFLCGGVIARALELSHNPGASADGRPQVPYHTVFSFLDLFGCGMLVASLKATLPALMLTGRVAALMISLFGFALFVLANTWCLHTLHGEWQMGYSFLCMWLFPTLACVGTAAMLFRVVMCDGSLGSLLAIRPLAYIGKISYSVYLFHFVVQLPMFNRFPLPGITDPSWRAFCWGLISLGPTLLIATLVYRTVEEPFMKLAARFKESTQTEKRLTQVLA